MKLTKPKRIKRVRITQQEIQRFPVQTLKVDPFWVDLYQPKMKPATINQVC